MAETNNPIGEDLPKEENREFGEPSKEELNKFDDMDVEHPKVEEKNPSIIPPIPPDLEKEKEKIKAEVNSSEELKEIKEDELMIYKSVENPGLQITIFDTDGNRYLIKFEKGIYQTSDPLIKSLMDEKYQMFKQKRVAPLYEPSGIRDSKIMREPTIIEVKGKLYKITPALLAQLVEKKLVEDLGSKGKGGITIQ